ncbi:MAG TPA: hypothetical protein VLU25_06025 [Acidobacteriota bacterium]|nr:hypothetical protein [Acidobacteriota bacterium]
MSATAYIDFKKHLRWILYGMVLMGFLGAAYAQRAQDCGVCHRKTHREWTRSAHSKAWSGENFQAQLERFGNARFCSSCHAPETVWKQADLIPDKGEEPPPFQALLATRAPGRESDLEDGVSCASCHFIEVLRPSGHGNDFLGPFHTDAAHSGIEVADFRSFRLCSACHGRAAEDYRPGGSPDPEFHHANARAFQFAFGKSDCGSCHMPARQERLVQFASFKHLPERQVGEHTFSGERYDMLQEALVMVLEGSTLRITNAKVGHPLQVWPTSRYRIEIARMEGDTAVETTSRDLDQAARLELGDTVEVSVPFPAGDPGGIRIKIFHRRGEESEVEVASQIF